MLSAHEWSMVISKSGPAPLGMQSMNAVSPGWLESMYQCLLHQSPKHCSSQPVATVFSQILSSLHHLSPAAALLKQGDILPSATNISIGDIMITLSSHHAAILMMPVTRENSVGQLKLDSRNFTQGMSMSIKQWSLSELLSDNHSLKCRKERCQMYVECIVTGILIDYKDGTNSLVSLAEVDSIFCLL